MEKEYSKQNIYLPDDFLEEILHSANNTANSIKKVYDHFIKNKRKIRKELLDLSVLQRFYSIDKSTQFKTIGVDGGRVHEHLLLFDIGLVSAIAVEGVQSHQTSDTIKYKAWNDIIPHYGSDMIIRVTKGIMHLFELELAYESLADFVFLDGRFITPIIGFNSIATVNNPQVLSRIEHLFVNKNLTTLLKTLFHEKQVVAIQKYDSSYNFSSLFLPQFNIHIDDRALFSLILEDTEYTKPILLNTFDRERELFDNAHINLKGELFSTYTSQEELKSFLAKLSNNLYVSYFKPRPWSPAIRVEIPEHIATSKTKLLELLHCIRSEIITPEMKEPYPLYLADIMAKSVSQGLNALKESAKSIVQKREVEEPEIFFESYRSE